jgi:hypothetical protein
MKHGIRQPNMSMKHLMEHKYEAYDINDMKQYEAMNMRASNK